MAFRQQEGALYAVRSLWGHEANLHTLVERLGDALRQSEGVLLVVGIFQTAHGRSRGSDTPSQLPL